MVLTPVNKIKLELFEDRAKVIPVGSMENSIIKSRVDLKPYPILNTKDIFVYVVLVVRVGFGLC